MRNKIAQFSLLLALMAMLQGCETSPERVVYNSLRITGDAVDAAMKTAADLYVIELITEEGWQKIAAAHDEYQPAFHAAVVLAQFDYTQVTPADVRQLASIVTATITRYTSPD